MEWTELEHLVLRLAGDLLKDPHASYYGTQGHEQHGLDVMAEDRRPDGTGKRWVFQAKNFLKTKLQPSHLKKLEALLEKYSHRESIDTFVVVTTSTVSPAVHDEAKELSERLRLTFKVWSWEVFWTISAPTAGRAPGCRRRRASPFGSGTAAGPPMSKCGRRARSTLSTWYGGATGVRLEEVLIARTLRVLPHPGEAHGQAPGGPPWHAGG